MKTNTDPKEGDLRIWWIPQIPGRPFCVDVKDIEQAIFLHDVLASYDDFQYKHGIKPDYSNAGGLEVFDADGDWSEWYDEEDDMDINDIMRERWYGDDDD